MTGDTVGLVGLVGLLVSNHCRKRSVPSFDLLFGTIMAKLKLFHVVERKMYRARQTFEINCHL